MDNDRQSEANSPVSDASPKSASLCKRDWLQAALEVLDELGAEGVKVLVLAKELNVTRGSFYWHFESKEDLLNQLLDYWEHEQTEVVIRDTSAQHYPPIETIRSVMVNVLTNHRQRYDNAIIVWGRSNPLAAKTYRRAVRKRLNYVKSLMVEAGLEPETAEFRTKVLYSWLMMTRDGLPKTTLKNMIRDIDHCLDLIFEN